MPDVPTNAQGWFHILYLLVDGGVGFTEAVGPQHLPGEKLRIAQHQPPDGDVVSIHRPLALAACIHEFCQLEKPLPCPLRTDAALPCLGLAKLAKASHVMRIVGAATSARAKRIRKWTLALRSPHHSIDLVGVGPVVDNA